MVNSRNIGLDVARSVAIILVLLAHGLDFFFVFPYMATTNQVPKMFDFLNFQFGFYGVEIFFVLSGFLIGSIIIKKVLTENTMGSLLEFYTRRWFRTIPLYFLVLIGLIIIKPVDYSPFANFLFIQNFNETQLSFLPVSWSLSIEEWFYLLTPFLLIVMNYFSKNNVIKNFFLFCFFVIIGTLLLRIFYSFGNHSFDFGTRKQIYLRLDSIMFGVLLAGIKIYKNDLYNKLTKNPKVLLVLSVLGFVLCDLYMGMVDLDQSFVAKTLLFTVISFISTLFVASLEKIDFKNMNKFAVKTFVFISTTSYAVYLLHYNIDSLLRKKVAVTTSLSYNLTMMAVAILVTYIASFVLHKVYEVPVMNLRDKIKFKRNRQEERIETKVS